MSSVNFDPMDREIVACLVTNARLTNKAIAESLGVTEGTIRARLKRLQDAGLIRFTALTNLDKMGPPLIVLIRVKTKLAQLRSVAEAIAAMSDFKSVTINTGSHGIFAMAMTDNLADGVSRLNAEIVALAGVEETQTSVLSHSFKYESGLARVRSMHDAEDDEDAEDA